MPNKEIKLFKFFSEDRPLTERFDVLEFQDCEDDILKYPIYKESYYSFLLLEEGEADITLDGVKSHVTAPAVVTGLPGDSWEWEHWSNIKGYFICFDAETLIAGLRGGYSLDPIPFLNPEQRYPFIPLSEARLTKLKTLTEDLIECISERPIFYDLIRAILWQFIFLTEKEYALNGNKGRKKEQKNHLLNFIHLVNKNYRSHHDAKFYADALNITPNYLNKITKSLLGLSAFDYITNRIISEAKVLLRLTKINISELAFKLGYENPGYVISIFKKLEGITPLEYQKKGTL